MTEPLQILKQSAGTLRQQTDKLTQVLTDFRTLPAYQRLAGSNGASRPHFTGDTAARAEALANRVCELFDWLTSIYSVLDLADNALASAGGMFGGQERIREAESLLNGPSVELSPQNNRVPPQTVIDNIARGAEWAISTASEIEDTANSLTQKLAVFEAEIGALSELTNLGDANIASQLDSARKKLQAFRPEIESDPLRIQQEFRDSVELPITHLRTVLQQAAHARQEVERKLAAAGALYDQLTATAKEVCIAGDEVRAKVSDHPLSAPPPPSEAVSELGTWLATLRKKAAEGLDKPVLIGLEHWEAKLRTLLSEAETALRANQAPVLARRELRGLLNALKTKAVARGLAENPKLIALAEEANTLLYARPTPLARAEQLVRDYERLLNGR